jgi:hypothetical protein
VVAHDARTAGGLPLPGQRPAACFTADLLQESIVARLTFGAICPQRSVGAAIVIPEVYVEAMNQHLAEITRCVCMGAIALLVLDGAGWHSSPRLNVPENIVLLPLPPYAPELNPVKNGSSCAATSSASVSGMAMTPSSRPVATPGTS